MTQRWKLTIEYDGTPFCGWQRQENAFSVQQCLEEAVRKFCGETVVAHVAGRTDAGVHALGQVAHIDLEKDADEKTVRDAISFHMRPHPAAVVLAEKAGDDFHARLSAVRRVYCYRILSSRRTEPVIDKNRVWHVSRDLNIAAMNKGARHLVGEHDFSSFRAAECQAKSPVRTLNRLEFIEGPAWGFGRPVEMRAEAKSFLHHQIRNMVGTLRLVGEEKLHPDDIKDILAARDRTKAGPMAPACGLYFVSVDYGDSAFVKGIDSLI